LFGELLNRPETIKLPTSLAIARNPEHPLADEARRVLAVCLPEDYGTNWGHGNRLSKPDWKKFAKISNPNMVLTFGVRPSFL